MKEAYAYTRKVCFTAYVAMAPVFCVPSMLFVTFHTLYGISYTLLGTLVLINFCTQLSIDLVFTFRGDRFDLKRTLTVMPLLTALGLVLYGVLPQLWPEAAFAGLAAGTVIFSVSAGLSEVLLSPVIAALPSEHSERDLSFLHATYGAGVILDVLLLTLFFRIFGRENWTYLVLLLSIFPVVTAVMFSRCTLPEMSFAAEAGSKGRSGRGVGLALCVICIFLGGTCEASMTNWISGFLEKGIGLDKAYCDLVGIAIFAGLLGMTRFLYSRIGKNIERVMLLSFGGCALSYLAAGLCPNAFGAALACILTGAFCAMLFPGTLMVMEHYMPGLGVSAYALMAAGGDLGASVAPQLLGAAADRISMSGWGARLGDRLALTREQIGLKSGMVLTAIYPLLGILVILAIRRYFKKRRAEDEDGGDLI